MRTFRGACCWCVIGFSPAELLNQSFALKSVLRNSSQALPRYWFDPPRVIICTCPEPRPYSASAGEVRHPPRSGWLDELGRLKGGRAVGLGVARCAPYWLIQNCPAVPSAASCSRMY